MKNSIELPKVRHPAIRIRTITPIVGESMTHQSHASSCDINNIIKRFDNTGLLPSGSREGQYADVTPLQGDFTDIINRSKELIEDYDRFRASYIPDTAPQQLDLEDEIRSLKARLDELGKPTQAAQDQVS